MTKKTKILKKVEYHSITEAMLVSLGIGLLLGILVGIFLKFGIDFIIQTDYLTEERIDAREKESVVELQNYVRDYNLRPKDMRHVDEWVKSANYLYVLIYRDGELFFESGNFSADTMVNSDTRLDELIKNEQEEAETNENDVHSYSGGIFVNLPTREALYIYTSQNDEYYINFGDEKFSIRVAEYSEYMYYVLGNVLSVFGGVLMFLGFLILKIHELSARIRKLGNDVITVAAGDIEHEISVYGDDEVSKLSFNVDNMRQSLVYSYKKQKDAQQANAELITAMSHDIRTPLTVLLGYIDMMKMKNDNDELASYIQASEHTALRLKKMSDDMFNYFRLFGSAELKTEIEVYSVSTLLSQMLQEYIFMLTERGYDVNSNIEILNTVSDIEIKTDAPQLARIVENLFSNMLKYADKNAPIFINVDVNADICKLTFTNNVAKNCEKVESNNIGLKTCVKIANALNVEFNAKREDDVFTVMLAIPTHKDEPIPSAEKKKGIKAAVSRILRAMGGFFAGAALAIKSRIASFARRKK